MLPARCAACSSAMTSARVVLLGITWVVWKPISLFTNSTPLSANAGAPTDSTTAANNKDFEDISLLLCSFEICSTGAARDALCASRSQM